MAFNSLGVSRKSLAFGRQEKPKAHPFLPRALQTQNFLRWLRRTHAWLGMAGAAAGVILGISGITLNHRAEIRNDVTKHVVGDNHVEPFRILHHPHTRCVHVCVIPSDIRVLRLADFMKGTLP